MNTIPIALSFLAVLICSVNLVKGILHHEFAVKWLVGLAATGISLIVGIYRGLLWGEQIPAIALVYGISSLCMVLAVSRMGKKE